MDTQQLLEAAQTIDILRSMFADDKNEWLPVIAAIGGAFVGGVSTFLPSYLLEKRKLKQEKRSVETALVSEVSALLEVIEHRRYVYGLEESVHYLKQNPDKKVSVRPSHLVRCSRLPVVGQQFVDGVVFLSRQAGQHILQIGIGIMPVQLGGLDQGHHRSRPLATTK